MDCTAGVPLLTKPLHLELKPSGPFSLRSSSMEAAPTGRLPWACSETRESVEACDTRSLLTSLQLAGGDTLLLPSSTISEVFELRPSAAQQGTVFPADTPTVLGSIRASWQRLQNPQKPAVRWVHQDLQLAEVSQSSVLPPTGVRIRGCTTRLPNLLVCVPRPKQIVKMPPLTVHTHCPEIGKLGVPFTLTLVIENHTTSLQVSSPRPTPVWTLPMHAWYAPRRRRCRVRFSTKF
jgi:hypothetical protein